MFVKVNKGQAAPITLTEFKKMHPKVSFPWELTPELLAEYGVYPARDMDRPSIDANQRATLSEGFTQVDGERVREWTVRTLTQDEVRAGMSCTRLQGLLVLGEVEVARLDAFIDAMPNAWALRQIVDNAVNWRRTSQDMQMLGYALSYTDEQMDALFISAVQIEV